MSWFISAVLRYRFWVATGVLLSLGLAAFSARNIEARFQFRDFYDHPSNPLLPAFKEHNEEFGDPAGYVVALIEADDVFRRDVLEYLRQVTEALEPAPEYSDVVSLVNATAIRGDGDTVETGPILAKVPASDDRLQELKETVLSDPLLVRRVVSADGTVTAILAEMRVPTAFARTDEQRAAISVMERALARFPAPDGVDVRLTGAPVLEAGTTDVLIKDQLLLTPLVILVLVVVLLLTFRSLHGVVLCLSTVSAATIWTAGIFAQFGRPVDLIGSIIPTTILVYGVVDPVFVLTRFLGKLDEGLEKRDAIVETFRELGLPCFLTSATTAIGFAAFAASIAPGIRYYGLTVAIGVALTFVTTVVVLPMLLWFAPTPARRFSAVTATGRVGRVLTATWGRVSVRPLLTSVLGCALLGGLGWYAYDQEINDQYTGQLADGPLQRDARAFEEKLAGVIRLAVRFEAEPGVLKRPEVLQAIAKLQDLIRSEPLVTYTASPADLVASVHRAFVGDDTAPRIVPKSQSLTSQYLTLVEREDREALVNGDYSHGQIVILMKDEGSASVRAMTTRLQREIDAADFGSLDVSPSITGLSHMGYHALDTLVLELIYGFVIAFLIVLGLEVLVFRSVRLALISIVPNLIPLGACFCLIRLSGVPLRFDNALVLCVAIGGLFNTTIHLIARVRQQVSAGADDPDAIVGNALLAVGPPSLITAVTLSAGFFVFTFSGFPGLRMLGILSMLTFLVGFLSDTVFSTAMLRAAFDWKRQLGKRRSDTPSPAFALGSRALSEQD